MTPRKRWTLPVSGAALLVLLIVIVGGGGQPAAAQDGIQILSEDVTVTFPYSVEFDMTAESAAAPISSVRLLWQAGPDDVFNVRPIRIVPGNSVEVAFPLNARFLELPPFAQIAYRWQIRDALGNELVTENRIVEYEDTNNDWQELSNERIRLLWYDHDEKFARQLFDITDAAYERLATAFGVELSTPPVVLIYPDQTTFTEFQSFMGGNLEFVIGRYFPGHNITANLVTRDMSPDVYGETIAHELSHLYSDNFYVGYTALPLWLEEGLATYNEAENLDAHLFMVRRAAAHDELVPFIDLPAAIRDANIGTANLAYAEGAMIFQYIQVEWGNAVLADFLASFRRTTNVDAVMNDVFGLSMVDFELAWRTWLGYPVDSVPQVLPTPTMVPFDFPTPVFSMPGSSGS